MQAARGSLANHTSIAELIKDVTSEYPWEVMELAWGWLARTMTDTMAIGTAMLPWRVSSVLIPYVILSVN